jgi:hypothetical protein
MLLWTGQVTRAWLTLIEIQQVQLKSSVECALDAIHMNKTDIRNGTIILILEFKCLVKKLSP